MTSLRGTVCFVVGASRGVGRACALLLAQNGCDVALLGRSEPHLQEVALECKRLRPECRTCLLPCDVTRKEQLLNAVGKCVNDLGGINILVVNSSAFAADTEGIFTHHAMSPIRLSELAAPYIRREAGSKLSGIVFISSLAAKLTFKGGAAFCASKHAVLGYAGCLFEDLREDGIKVSTILPGYVSSEVPNTGGLNSEKMIQPSDVAEACLFILQSPPTSCPTEITLRPQRTPYVSPNVSAEERASTVVAAMREAAVKGVPSSPLTK